MPLINVQLIRGRTPEQKRALMRGIAQVAMDTLGSPEASVRVILNEVEPEHWGIGLKTKADG
jgi:4-oxalocrotonate tautomerase